MILSYALFIAAILFIQTANATANTNNKGKLLGTATTTSLEGPTGGGITPWTVLSSFATRVNVAAYRLAFGIEYRQKPDNLSFAKEEGWYLSLTAYLR